MRFAGDSAVWKATQLGNNGGTIFLS